MTTYDLISQHHPCADALAWARRHPEPREAWATCERGDWLLWIATRLGVDRRALVIAACQCARLALPYVPAGEVRPLRAIETAEAWACGEATIEEVRRERWEAAAAGPGAGAAAYYAATTAYAAAAYYAATTAYAAAAYDATVAAYAAYAAAHAVAVANAVGDTRRGSTRAALLRDCAVLVRSVIAYEMLGVSS